MTRCSFGLRVYGPRVYGFHGLRFNGFNIIFFLGHSFFLHLKATRDRTLFVSSNALSYPSTFYPSLPSIFPLSLQLYVHAFIQGNIGAVNDSLIRRGNGFGTG
jgi:hypothetical protein